MYDSTFSRENALLASRAYLPHFNSLLALRFFVAAAVAFGHTLGVLVWQVELFNTWGISSLMVFFHILSGFTLAYVYPKLDGQMNVLRFWMARVGRIWPVHLLVIVVIILCLQRDRILDHFWWWQLFSNLTLTQSWFPAGGVVQVFNAPAWSLSTEFGLYLFFPFLIHRWNQTWHIKLLASLCLSIGLVAYCNFCQDHDSSLLSRLRINPSSLIYIHPFARMFEFCLGMTMALFWERIHQRYRQSAFIGTVLEAGTVVLCLTTMLHAKFAATALDANFHLGPVLTSWLQIMLIPLLPFSILIFVFSMNRGKITSLLGFPLLVFLGELSFSLYLVHVPLLHGFLSGVHDKFDYLPAWATLPAFWACSLLAAHIVFRFWEQPARKFFRQLLPSSATKGKILDTPQQRNLPCPNSGPQRRKRLASWILPASESIIVLSLLVLVLYDGNFRPHIQLINAEMADHMARAGLPEVRDLRFGDRFVLKALVPQWSDKGLEVDLAWQSLREQSLDYIQAVHFVDKKGNLMGGADHPQEVNHLRVSRNTIWMDKLTFSRTQLIGTSYLGLGLYRPGENLLPVSGGVVDWNGGRLLISFANELGVPNSLALKSFREVGSNE